MILPTYLNGIKISGGGVPHIELTKAEYDALPIEVKNNGSIYFITDDVSGGGEFAFIQNGDCYSTEERMIGCWTDGKPIYQKTLIINNPANNTDLTYSLGVPDLDEVIYQGGTFDRVIDGGIWTYSLNAVNEATFINTYIVLARIRNITKELYIRVGQTYPDIPNIRFTFRYTKTTDRAGSGSWTPNGMPAIHYSTEEQVIGTWFGQTLYEKSFDLSSNPVTLSRGNWVNVVQLANVSKIIDATAIYSNMKLAAIEFSYDAGYVTAQWVANSSDTRRISYLTVKYTKS